MIPPNSMSHADSVSEGVGIWEAKATFFLLGPSGSFDFSLCSPPTPRTCSLILLEDDVGLLLSLINILPNAVS